jgi:hypothetical protein
LIINNCKVKLTSNPRWLFLSVARSTIFAKCNKARLGTAGVAYRLSRMISPGQVSDNSFSRFPVILFGVASRPDCALLHSHAFISQPNRKLFLLCPLLSSVFSRIYMNITSIFCVLYILLGTRHGFSQMQC